ncbi:MAG TPA: gamma-glutamyl-gamma-aminobutyrate hydrolase family protein [Bacteriovoracaceae bacterium]|nr:gamma-glutamyl-gamma-aminobutyrate hydrolase family protein [Bacteriovoracaceae bacterium]
MKLFLVLLLVSSFSWSKCELPPNEVIKIGCSHECGFMNSLRLKIAALSTGHKIELIDLKTDLALIDEMDAFLIPGGEDIHYRLYIDKVDRLARNQIEKYNSHYRTSENGDKRDLFESRLLKTYNEEERFSRVPLLGICRGMQMMGVAQGLPLYQDIEEELKIPNREYVLDKVEIPQGPTVMSAIFPGGSFYATKYHHQGINLPYYFSRYQEFPEVKVTAFSHNKKIAEALEYTHRPALGVQFHPEYSLPSGIFQWFLNKACEKKLN